MPKRKTDEEVLLKVLDDMGIPHRRYPNKDGTKASVLILATLRFNDGKFTKEKKT